MEDKTQKTKKMRGSATLREDGSFDFRPDGEGQSRMENVKTARKSRLYSTAGAKQRSLVAHLSVPADSADPVADLYEDLQKLTEGQQTGVKTPTLAGRILEKKDDYRVVMNQTKGTLDCTFSIDLRKDADYLKKFYELINSITKCLHYNENSVRQLCRALAKNGRK